MLTKLYQAIETGEYRGANVVRRGVKAAFWMGLALTFLTVTWMHARARDTDPMAMLLLSFMSLTLLLTAMLSFMRTEEDEVEEGLADSKVQTRLSGDRFRDPVPQPVLANRRYPRRHPYRQDWN